MAILAAIGEERHANPVVDVAHDLARAYGDRLDVLHVVPEGEFGSHKAAIEDFSFAQEEASAAEFAEEVAAETLDGHGSGDGGEGASVAVSGIGRVGDPVEQTVSVVAETDPRYLVVGGRRRSPAGKAVFGSTTQDILLRADVPVTTVMQDGE